ncbi:hypothetical protein M422DRAFT_35807 [Sphaerobolus stellatus SS14]|uniref:Uncharacterized protein n=1 Tax=Sphaerobolus stellatus (strain SS14) TaxID=990650 RepID=A0A0C9V4L2_SPHS4|nr:hypothetical protein M422DRAFT_35807 [Sphaerobolus stellatus SS14]
MQPMDNTQDQLQHVMDTLRPFGSTLPTKYTSLPASKADLKRFENGEKLGKFRSVTASKVTWEHLKVIGWQDTVLETTTTNINRH